MRPSRAPRCFCHHRAFLCADDGVLLVYAPASTARPRGSYAPRAHCTVATYAQAVVCCGRWLAASPRTAQRIVVVVYLVLSDFSSGAHCLLAVAGASEKKSELLISTRIIFQLVTTTTLLLPCFSFPRSTTTCNYHQLLKGVSGSALNNTEAGSGHPHTQVK